MAESRQLLAQNPTTRPIELSNRKMASVFNQVKISLSRAGQVEQQYKVHTKVRVAIDALDYEYNNDARTRSPRLSAVRLQVAVGRWGSDLETVTVYRLPIRLPAKSALTWPVV